VLRSSSRHRACSASASNLADPGVKRVNIIAITQTDPTLTGSIQLEPIIGIVRHVARMAWLPEKSLPSATISQPSSSFRGNQAVAVS